MGVQRARAGARSCRAARAGSRLVSSRCRPGHRHPCEVGHLVVRSGRSSTGSLLQYRTMQLWLAVASSVPSSANMCTRPWPNPRSTAWTWMSSSTQSVGTRRTMRSVLSRLLPPPRMPRPWPTPIGTKSPSTASAAPSTPSSTSGMRAHSRVWPLPGVPSSSSSDRPRARRCSSRLLIVSPTAQAELPAGQSSGAGTSARHRLELCLAVERAGHRGRR